MPRMNGYDSVASSVTRCIAVSVGPVGMSWAWNSDAPETESRASLTSKSASAETVSDSIHVPSST